jgi:hypothetical protein
MTLAPRIADVDGVAHGRSAEVQRLVGVGATVLAERDFPGSRLTVLAEICVSG